MRNKPFSLIENGHGNVDKTTIKLFDSSTACIGHEESLREKEDNEDSIKLNGCGICCQSYSTKDETMQCLNIH